MPTSRGRKHILFAKSTQEQSNPVMVIQRLPSSVVSSLRTDVTVTTTAQCVTELVLNAIDAGSTSIAVRIDLKNFRIQVIDNGCGFSVSDLNLVGARYMTSKCHSVRDLQGSLKYYGFRGEALSSISDVSGTLTIVSRHKDTEDTYCKVFSAGAALKVGRSRQQRASCGSTITVADFLYNRPVRRARIKPALDLEEIKTSLEAVALINPHVSFSLRNDNNNDVIMQTQKVIDIPTVFRTLYGNNIAKSLIPVKESVGPFSVEGYISNEAHLLKNLQFIYVNKRLLLRTKIHKLVNSIMSRSAIMKSNNVPHAPISKEIDHNVFLAFSPPKRDKHAIFVLNITCPLSEYDITLDPKKTLVEFCDWDSLLTCFEKLLRNFIEYQDGPSTGEEPGLEWNSHRRVETVIDEINELARQQAMGAKSLQGNKESISTRDLPRAVHSLPANRFQVNLSEESPTECLLSTSSSEFCASDLKYQEKDRGDTYLDPFIGSAFTEQPYPPLSNKESYKGKNATTAQNAKVCFLASPFGTSASTNSKVVDGQSNVLLKKPVKGFLPQIVHFEEDFRKNRHSPLKKKSILESTLPSPVNALASIHEIRRKKFLSNLKKFSFNSASRKPVLHKDQSNLKQAEKGFVDNEEQAMQGKVQQRDKNKEQGSPLSVKNIDIQSVIATIASSTGSEVCSSEASRPILTDSAVQVNLDQTKSTDKCSVSSKNNPKRLNFIEKIQDQTSSGNYHQSLSVSYPDSRNSSCVPDSGEQSIAYETESLRRVLSVDDMISFKSSSAFAKTNNECFQSDGIRSSLFEPSLESDLNSVNFIGQSIIDNKKCNDENFEIFDTVECGMLSHNVNSSTTKQLKIVDYDSSPPSSQENFTSGEGLHESNSNCPMPAEKRKGGGNADSPHKRLCVFGDSFGNIENISNPAMELENCTHEVCVPSKTFLPESTITEKNMESNAPYHMLCDKNLSFDDETELISLNPLSDLKSSDSQNLSIIVPSSSVKNSEAVVLAAPEEVWLKKFDHSGKPFYLHKDSGVTTYHEPNQGDGAQFKFNDRFSFLPKGMSPILNDTLTNELSYSPSITKFHKCDEDLSAIKWDKKQSNQSNLWPLVDQLLGEADIFSSNLTSQSQVTNSSVQELPKFDVQTYNVAFPYTFTKDVFHKLRVLGQLDNKFIVTIAALNSERDVVVLFDQHAVHERIRVENLTEAYKCNGTSTWRSSSVDPALPLPLSNVEVRILNSYKEKMERLGFYFTAVDSHSIEVQRVPTCLLLRENREVNGRGVSVLRQHLESLIREQVDSLLNTRGVGTDHPKIIQNVISYEACRGAVKFGHSLTVADCEAFLQNLSTCDLPFQCAHGRPALVPIVDLSMLKKKLPRGKPNLWKLKKIQQTQNNF